MATKNVDMLDSIRRPDGIPNEDGALPRTGAESASANKASLICDHLRDRTKNERLVKSELGVRVAVCSNRPRVARGAPQRRHPPLQET